MLDAHHSMVHSWPGATALGFPFVLSPIEVINEGILETTQVGSLVEVAMGTSCIRRWCRHNHFGS